MKTQLRVQIGSLVHAQIPRTFSQDGLAHQVGYQHLDLAMRLVNQAISPKDLHAYDYLNILIESFFRISEAQIFQKIQKSMHHNASWCAKRDADFAEWRDILAYNACLEYVSNQTNKCHNLICT